MVGVVEQVGQVVPSGQLSKQRHSLVLGGIRASCHLGVEGCPREDGGVRRRFTPLAGAISAIELFDDVRECAPRIRGVERIGQEPGFLFPLAQQGLEQRVSVLEVPVEAPLRHSQTPGERLDTNGVGAAMKQCEPRRLEPVRSGT